MGKAIADPLFIFLVVIIGVQAALYLNWRKSGRLARFALIVLSTAAVGLWLLGTHAAESYLIGRLNSVHPIPSREAVADIDVVIVLSGGFVAAPVAAYEQLDTWTTARVVQGVRTFFESDARLLVVSGRWARGEARDEGRGEERGEELSDDSARVTDASAGAARMAQSMKQLAVNLGVPGDKIVVEPLARTTREHPLELLNLNVVEAGDTVGVVTSSWHLPRAMREFEKHFPALVAVPAFDTAIDDKRGLLRWMPRSRSLASSATALAEYIGMIWYRNPFLDQ